MNIKVVQSGQGLLSVMINNQFSGWKIANRLGIWNLYKAETDLKWNHDLASVVHKPDQLNKLIAEFIKAAD
tara:strand:+ start:1971 stop:2183 length:213 start_codon:yes stop_codon:yes gene_type:complete